MSQTPEYAYRFWLNHVPGIGSKTALSLVRHFGDARSVYSCPAEQLLEAAPLLGIGSKALETLLSAKNVQNVEITYQKFCVGPIRFTYHGAPDYPARLLQIPDPPSVLYYRGALPEEHRPTVAIIGARKCSSYGREMARYFASALADSGVQIISGLALGIDGIAQEAAILTGGKSFGVLGCSVDICYPKTNLPIYNSILTNGGILSEYHPSTFPKPNLFPPRNRIISGLSDLLLVVEAKEQSGTQITVDMALEQGREVFAVPGRVNDALSQGPNKLIRQGACIATSPTDLLSALYYEETGQQMDKNASASPGIRSSISSVSAGAFPAAAAPLSAQEKLVFQAIAEQSQNVNELFLSLKRKPCEDFESISKLLPVLLGLQLKGLLAQDEAGRYALRG